MIVRLCIMNRFNRKIASKYGRCEKQSARGWKRSDVECIDSAELLPGRNRRKWKKKNWASVNKLRLQQEERWLRTA